MDCELINGEAGRCFRSDVTALYYFQLYNANQDAEIDRLQIMASEKYE